MEKQESGLIVNICSIGGLIAHSHNVAAYVASKHALVGFSRGLVQDFAHTGIRVLAVCPHLTDTDFFSASQGADVMAPEVNQYRTFMDSPDAVARGIIDQLDSDRLIVFPTKKPENAYKQIKDI